MPPTTRADHTYLVECFAPGIREAAIDGVASEARAAAARVAENGLPIEYLGATLVPDDEVVLLSFRAGAVDAVRAVTAGLSVSCGRIVQAVVVERGVVPPA